MAEHRNQPMREALRMALHEEMLRDERVFVMGEEVGVWQGTHRVTRGLLEEFGAKRVRDTPISEMAIAGTAVGAAMAGSAACSRDDDHQLRFPGAGCHHQPRRQNSLYVQRAVHRAAGHPRGHRLGRTGHRHPLAHARTDFRPFPRPAGGLPSTPSDAKGMLKAAIRDENPVLFTESIALYPKPGPVPEDPDLCCPSARAMSSARAKMSPSSPTRAA